MRLSAGTVSQYPSLQTEIADLFRDFGRLYMNPWVPGYSSAQRITHRQMVNLNALYKLLRTCYVLVYWISRFSGMNTYHFVSSPIIIASIQASAWHLLRRFMAVDTELQFVGNKSVNIAFMDLR